MSDRLARRLLTALALTSCAVAVMWLLALWAWNFVDNRAQDELRKRRRSDSETASEGSRKEGEL